MLNSDHFFKKNQVIQTFFFKQVRVKGSRVLGVSLIPNSQSTPYGRFSTSFPHQDRALHFYAMMLSKEIYKNTFFAWGSYHRHAEDRTAAVLQQTTIARALPKSCYSEVIPTQPNWAYSLADK